jgi:hypothetical protein
MSYVMPDPRPPQRSFWRAAYEGARDVLAVLLAILLVLWLLLAVSNLGWAQVSEYTAAPVTPQTDVTTSKLSGPWSVGLHAYLEPQFFTGGGGFGPGITSTGGLDFEQRHFLLLGNGSYGFIRKTNDGDQVPNEGGHTRGAEGETFWRVGGNFAGIGANWGETAVTPYRKYAWAPEIAVGRDFRESVRLMVAYWRSRREYTDYPAIVQFTPGPGQPKFSRYCICNNGVSGVRSQLWFAPFLRGHAMLHYDVGVIFFHQTVTDPYNAPLTSFQDSQKYFSGSFTLGVQFRY